MRPSSAAALNAPWMLVAKRYAGLRERTPDGQLSPVVRDFFMHTRFPMQLVNVRTHWCSAFACAALELASVPSPRSARARDFLPWGVELCAPVYGALLVFERGAGGHVGFCDRSMQLSASTVSCFGGNQGNAVCSAQQQLDKLLGVRWPKGWALPADAVLAT